MEIEVHQKKRDIGSGVGITETIVEFDTVKNAEWGGEANVFQVDVAIAVTDESLADAFGKERLTFGHKGFHPLPDHHQVHFRKRCADEFSYLPEVFFPVFPDARAFAIFVYCPATFGIEMETGDDMCDVSDIRCGYLSFGKQSVEHALFRESFHLYRIIDDLAFAAKGCALRRFPYLDHSQVDLRAETAVQPDLFIAVKAAQINGSKVHKTEINRFFNFIDKIIRDKKK
jgi:hypothetical protein